MQKRAEAGRWSKYSSFLFSFPLFFSFFSPKVWRWTRYFWNNIVWWEVLRIELRIWHSSLQSTVSMDKIKWNRSMRRCGALRISYMVLFMDKRGGHFNSFQANIQTLRTEARHRASISQNKRWSEPRQTCKIWLKNKSMAEHPL